MGKVQPGQKYGLLTVIEKTNKKKNNHYLWKCLCDCGMETLVRGDSLTNGSNKSCGCLGKKIQQEFILKGKNSIVDITKQKFGKLTVIKRIENSSPSKWLCRCECGNEITVTLGNLTSGNTKTCGCGRKIKSKGEQKIENLLNKANIPFIREKTFKECKFNDTNYPAKFDFYVNNQYIIEYDGEQHFKAVPFWGGEEGLKKIQERDKIKTKWCEDNNIPLIRIPYTKYDTLTIDDLILK